jgi:hypothetical protein
MRMEKLVGSPNIETPRQGALIPYCAKAIIPCQTVLETFAGSPSSFGGSKTALSQNRRIFHFILLGGLCGLVSSRQGEPVSESLQSQVGESSQDVYTTKMDTSKFGELAAASASKQRFGVISNLLTGLSLGEQPALKGGVTDVPESKPIRSSGPTYYPWLHV